MEKQRLDEMRARVDVATPGPWWWMNAKACLISKQTSVLQPVNHEEYGIDILGGERDKAFIAHSREDIPALLAEVERLQGELEAAKEAIDDLSGIACGYIDRCNYCVCGDGPCPAQGLNAVCEFEYARPERSPKP